jgi:hypothetical protein
MQAQHEMLAQHETAVQHVMAVPNEMPVRNETAARNAMLVPSAGWNRRRRAFAPEDAMLRLCATLERHAMPPPRGSRTRHARRSPAVC